MTGLRDARVWIAVMTLMGLTAITTLAHSPDNTQVDRTVTVKGKMTLTAIYDGPSWIKFFVKYDKSDNSFFNEVCQNSFGDVTVRLIADSSGSLSTRLVGTLPFSLGSSMQSVSPPQDVTVFGYWDVIGSGKGCVIMVEIAPYLVTVGSGSTTTPPPPPPPSGGSNEPPRVHLSLDVPDAMLKLLKSNKSPVITTQDNVEFFADATDPNGDDLSYEWIVNDQAASNATSANVIFHNPAAGAYEVEVVVRDGRGGSDSDRVSFSVHPIKEGSFVAITVGTSIQRSGGRLFVAADLARVYSGLPESYINGFIADCEGVLPLEARTDLVLGNVEIGKFVRVVGWFVAPCGVAVVQEETFSEEGHALFVLQDQALFGTASNVREEDGWVTFQLDVRGQPLVPCSRTMTVKAEAATVRNPVASLEGQVVEVLGAFDEISCTLLMKQGSKPLEHYVQLEGPDGSSPSPQPLSGSGIGIRDGQGNEKKLEGSVPLTNGNIQLFLFCEQLYGTIVVLQMSLERTLDRGNAKDPEARAKWANTEVEQACSEVGKKLGQPQSAIRQAASFTEPLPLELLLYGGRVEVEVYEHAVQLTVDTPSGTVFSAGTGAFEVQADASETQVAVFEGSVSVTPDDGTNTVTVSPGNRVSVFPDRVGSPSTGPLDPPAASSLAEALDTNNNGRLDDPEITRAITLWITGQTVPGTSRTISDEEIRGLITMWIVGTPVAAVVAQGGPAVRLWAPSQSVREVQVSGDGIVRTRVQVFDLNGRLMQESAAAGLGVRFWVSGLANGVYLYVVSAEGAGGNVWRSGVRKFVVLR